MMNLSLSNINAYIDENMTNKILLYTAIIFLYVNSDACCFTNPVWLLMQIYHLYDLSIYGLTG